jgi:multiple sugar transport system substrate-binding protein
MTKISRRDFLRAAGASAAAVAVSGLVDYKQISMAAPPRQDTEVVTFTMYGHPEMAEEMVALFNETHPGIEVRFERSEGQGYTEKVLAMIAGGIAPDVFRTSPNEALRFGIKDVVVEMTPFIEADTEYPADLYLPGVIDAISYEGKTYGLPVWCLTMWLYYNKRLFDEAGLDYPTPETTWEEFVAMAEALTITDDSGNITQFGANGLGSWQMPIAQDAWSNGGNYYYNDDLTAFDMDSPETIQVLEDEAAVMNVLKAHPSPLSPPSTPVSLLSKKVAMQWDGDWLVWDQRDQWADEFDATLCPLRNGNRVNIYWPDPMVINKNARSKEAAYRWISWFAADPASWEIQGSVVFPVTKRQYEDPALRDSWLRAPRPQGMLDHALEHSQNMKLWRVEPHSTEFENNIYWPEIDKIWRNAAPAQEVCETITRKGNELINNPID